MGHQNFIKHLRFSSENEWLNKSNIDLLSSIAVSNPEFVLEKLRPLAFQSEENDNKIYSALCYDARDDSDEMFKFRLELLEKHPIFVNRMWSLNELIIQNSPRVIDVIEALIRGGYTEKKNNTYWGSKEELKKYAFDNSQTIINRILPLIHNIAPEYPNRPNIIYLNRHDVWLNHDNNDSFARMIVDLLKDACCKCAISNSDEFMLLAKKTTYPIPTVENEILIYGLLFLPNKYSTDVITWLIAEFDYKIFVQTYNPDDYLAYTKDLIRKYSENCEVSIFTELENKILKWNEGTVEMINHFKRRFDDEGNFIYSNSKQFCG